MMTLQNGMILGGTYQIIEEIGSGGGGVVYKARHLRLNTEVVVKRIRDEVRGKIQSRREADVLKKLKHPYLPRVYDFIETQEAVYTVMDYIPGVSLDKVLQQYKRLPQKQVLRWAEELSEALAYLHSQKPAIIHSDIKPANIILTPQGHICLIDFNISVVLDQSMKATLGISAGYSSPEQYLSVSQHYNSQNTSVVDIRSDVYSLGCVLYHLLAGFPPNTDFNKRIPIGTVQGVSEGFATIIEKMIQYYPNQRYQDGKACEQAIKSCYKLDKRYIRHHKQEKMMFAISLVLFFIGALLICGGIYRIGRERETAYQEQLMKAEKKAQKGDFDQAIDAMIELEEDRPTRIEAYEKELYFYYQLGAYEDCAERGDEIVSLREIELRTEEDMELMGDIFYLISNAYYELEDYKKAQKAIEEGLEYHTENSLYYRDYCVILARQGKLDKAEDALEDAIDRDLEDDSINYAQGEIHAVRGETDQAIACFWETIKYTEDANLKKRAILLCATTLRDAGRIAEELELLESARQETDNHEKLVITEYLADAYMRMGDQDPENVQIYNNQALQLLEELKQNGYVTYQLQENMAILYEENGSFDAAEEVLRKLASDYPDNYKVYKRLAFLEADRQQYLENSSRSYTQMKDYYDQAVSLYEKQDVQDMEMQMLDNMIRDLQNGGWFS